jgi:hypothetical protein
MILSVVAAFMVPNAAFSGPVSPLPDAVFSGNVGCGAGPGEQTDSAGTFSIGSDGCATATLSYLDVPVAGMIISGEASVTAGGNNMDVTGTGIGYYSSGVSAEVTYYFEVVGSPSVPVLIDITGTGSASATSANNSGQYAAAGFVTPFGDLSACYSSAVGACSPGVSIPTSFSTTLSGYLTPGTIYEIDVSAGGTAGGFFGSAFSASADPQVAIDPSFPDASDFTLEFSPNFTSAAPEPSSASLLAIGLGLGAVLRFRSARPRRS